MADYRRAIVTRDMRQRFAGWASPIICQFALRPRKRKFKLLFRATGSVELIPRVSAPSKRSLNLHPDAPHVL